MTYEVPGRTHEVRVIECVVVPKTAVSTCDCEHTPLESMLVGHAAAIGKLFPVQRVVMLSSPCDGENGTAASWTKGSVGTWASDPSQFYGLAAPTTNNGMLSGDTTCPYHAMNWQNLGMISGRSHDDAQLCGLTGDTHSASIKCKDNEPAWLGMLQ